jgi:hypothetical protein
MWGVRRFDGRVIPARVRCPLVEIMKRIVRRLYAHVVFFSGSGGGSPPKINFTDLGLVDLACSLAYFFSWNNVFLSQQIDEQYFQPWLFNEGNGLIMLHQASAINLSLFGSLDFHSFASLWMRRNTCWCVSASFLKKKHPFLRFHKFQLTQGDESAEVLT